MQAIQISQAAGGKQQKPTCNVPHTVAMAWMEQEKSVGKARVKGEGRAATLTTTTTTRFATEIDPVAAVLQRLRMLRIARNVSSSCNTLRKQAQLPKGRREARQSWGGGHNSCAKKPSHWQKASCQRQSWTRSLASSKCDLTKWVNMPPKLVSNCATAEEQREEEEGGERATWRRASAWQ